MVRSSMHRASKYDKKIGGLVLPGQAARYTLTTGKRIALERCVKTQAISPMLQVPYVAYLEDLVKHASGNRPDEAYIIFNKWLSRELDETTLRALAECVGIGIEEAVVSCHYAVDANTLALWYLDDMVGVVAQDETGNYPLSFKGPGEPAWTADSKCGAGACQFDGLDDLLQNSTLLDVVPASGTVEFWFRPSSTLTTATAGNIRFINKYSSSTHNMIIWFRGSADATRKGRICIYISAGAQEGWASSTTTTWTAGTWYHIAGTWGATGLKLYVNGVLEGPGAYAGSWDDGTYTNFIIGRHAVSGADPFDGTMDEIRVSNIQRTTFIV